MSPRGHALAPLVAALTSYPVLAHGPFDGVGGYYHGLVHPVLVPAHLMLLVAVGLFFGQQGPTRTGAALGVFVIGLIAGIFSTWPWVLGEMRIPILLLSTLAGILVAINPTVRPLWCVLLGGLTGLLVGMDSSQGSLSARAGLMATLGTGVAICLLLFVVMALAEWFQKRLWQRTGVRIVGSWVAASSILVLALSFSAMGQHE